jgi:hypothetical protein
MRTYLQQFYPCLENRRVYPYRVIYPMIATHSPFLLAIPNARIYDLDARPSMEKAWYELENMKAYYRLFKQFECRFCISFELYPI